MPPESRYHPDLGMITALPFTCMLCLCSGMMLAPWHRSCEHCVVMCAADVQATVVVLSLVRLDWYRRKGPQVPFP